MIDNKPSTNRRRQMGRFLLEDFMPTLILLASMVGVMAIAGRLVAGN